MRELVAMDGLTPVLTIPAPDGIAQPNKELHGYSVSAVEFDPSKADASLTHLALMDDGTERWRVEFVQVLKITEGHRLTVFLPRVH